MKIIDAIWEKRNLGVDVLEINCSAQDTVEELGDVLESIQTPYSVVKIPTGCISLLMKSQQYGYQFIETSFHYEASLKKIVTPSIIDRFMRNVYFAPASESLKERALDEIKEGLIFSTDRVALDPRFSPKISGIRYYNWCIDALGAGADMEVAYFNGEPVAYNISQLDKNRNGVVYGILGGMFSESINKGLGFLLVSCEKECCHHLGGRICAGATSSNNLQSLRLHMHFGFDITSSDYVLIKHI